MSVSVSLSSTQLVAMYMVTSTMVTLVIWVMVLPFMAYGAEITDADQFVTEYLERALVTKLGERSNVGNRKPWEEDVRLPRHIIPLHYDIYLHPNLEIFFLSSSSYLCLLRYQACIEFSNFSIHNFLRRTSIYLIVPPSESELMYLNKY